MNHIKIKEWKDDLIWCPSQCYGAFKLYNQIFTLYLRWRHNDPWQGHIIIGNMNMQHDFRNDIWSTDLFLKYHVQYKDSELDLAKKSLIKLSNKEINKILKIHKEDLPLHINDEDPFTSALVNILLKFAPVTQ